MLGQIKINKFKSLRNINLELGKLTVLVGPNNSGKSNLIDFFRLLSEAADDNLANGLAQRGGYEAVQFDKNTAISWELSIKPYGIFKVEKTDVVYRCELRPSQYSGYRVFKEGLFGMPRQGHSSEFEYFSKDSNTAKFRFHDVLEKKFKEISTQEPQLFKELFESETYINRIETSNLELSLSQVRDSKSYPTVDDKLVSGTGCLLQQVHRWLGAG